jgi:1-acyl-sn-glycerol-3-phosphate acyltransferase
MVADGPRRSAPAAGAGSGGVETGSAGEVTVAARRIGFWYRLAVLVLKPPAVALTERRWEGLENLPAAGGVIVAANHYSHADPVTLAHCLYDSGRMPRFLAKAELFRTPLVGTILRGAAQIPVARNTADAGAALAPAVAALRRGECVVIYPEGTTTRDPARWPMAARTGVARLALASGCPVVPVAQWGAQRLHDTNDGWHLRRVRVTTRFGAPLDLGEFLVARVDGEEPSAETLHAVTAVVMDRVRALLGDIRGEQPPERIWGARGRDRPDERRSA